ncbi:MAG: PBP1A family penicillin-binding protein [Synergistaceae bacterium]|nr:PBP1A family penicillin-binding protein [Synergistaceae bacterium]
MLFVLALLILLGAAISVFVALYLGELSRTLPTETEIMAHRSSVASVIFDRNGEMVARLFTENRQPVELRNISPWVIKATLAAEDSSFYQHGGIRLLSILRASVENLSSGGIRQGGSTITQQLARNLFLSQERKLDRKLKEIILAIRMEQLFSKDRIIEMYLNTIYFGHGAWGVDTAARTYFGKTASQVNLPEAAMLAGLIAAPGRYSPLSNFEVSKNRQRYVLDRLEHLGWINEDEKRAAYDAELAFHHTPNRVQEYNRAPYFVAHLLFNELLPKYGPELVYSGGMEIHTTLDLKMQEAAEKAMEGLKSQGAIVGMNPETGEVLALVGGHDFEKSKFNRATQAYRQPGSSFKPVVYATAFESGLLPTDHFLDMKIEYEKKGPKQTLWAPGNYEGKYNGEVTLQYALIRSLNTVAVRLIDYLGAEAVAEMSRRMGVVTPHLPQDLSLALGSASVTPLEMAAAFSVFANNGMAVDPLMIREIRSSNGDLLESRRPFVREAMAPEVAITVRSALIDAVRAGTGRKAMLADRETFGKTGTTNDHTDAWFLGGVPGLVAVVYAGNDDHTPLGKRGVTGGDVAAPVWNAFVGEAVKTVDLPTKFEIPPDADVEPVTFCRTTGFRAINGCSATTVYMRTDEAPQTDCPIHGGDVYASAMDPNAPRLILVHDDAQLYAAGGYTEAYPEVQPVYMLEQRPEVVVPESTTVYRDPNPASSVEDRYLELLKQYGISN